jgi:hypothetical protein
VREHVDRKRWFSQVDLFRRCSADLEAASL